MGPGVPGPGGIAVFGPQVVFSPILGPEWHLICLIYITNSNSGGAPEGALFWVWTPVGGVKTPTRHHIPPILHDRRTDGSCLCRVPP